MQTSFVAPDFYVFGAAKAGTTSLWKWLNAHPDVFFPATKEPSYFAFAHGRAAPKAGPFDRNYVGAIPTTLEDYRALYDARENRTTGDASVCYLQHAEAAARISTLRPDARIVVVLRDPVDRAFSQYLHHRRDSLEAASFLDALQEEHDGKRSNWSWAHRYAAGGDYRDQITNLLDHFPRSACLFLPYEQLKADPDGTWRQLCAHLGLAQIPCPDMPAENQTQNLTSLPGRPGAERFFRNAGPVQRALKTAVPPKVRSVLRRAISGPPADIPVLDADSRAFLIARYRDQRGWIEQTTGLDLSGWQMT